MVRPVRLKLLVVTPCFLNSQLLLRLGPARPLESEDSTDDVSGIPLSFSLLFKTEDPYVYCRWSFGMLQTCAGAHVVCAALQFGVLVLMSQRCW